MKLKTNLQNPVKLLSKFCLVVTLLLILIFSASAESYQTYIHNTVTSQPLSYEPGKFVDSNTGGSTYSYSIEVPEGVNGLTPPLSLNYNSNAKNSYPSLVGSGWSITESYIQRNVKYTPADPNDDTFTLILNGVAYDLISTTDGYKTKPETFMKIQLESGGFSTYQKYWLVKTKDGTTYYFGYNTATEVLSNMGYGYTWRWYLEKIVDIHDNRLYYNYGGQDFGDIGVKHISNIIYNFGSVGDYESSVTFVYDLLPRSWIIFDNGQKIKITSVIKQIKI